MEAGEGNGGRRRVMEAGEGNGGRRRVMEAGTEDLYH